MPTIEIVDDFIREFRLIATPNDMLSESADRR